MEVQPESTEALMRHAGFVRALARSMLADEHLAEDAAQEAWAAALRHPPERLSTLRAWLRTVVRHAAGRLVRTRNRSRRVEEERARIEAAPGTAESAARNELLRRVTDEVLSLREPYRETLLLRFYEGWTPSEIAAHCGTSDKAIYSRIQRGLALLKERLDRGYGGERATWARTLLPLTLAGWEPKPASAGSSWFAAHPKAAFLTACGISFATIAWWTERARQETAIGAPSFARAASEGLEALPTLQERSPVIAMDAVLDVPLGDDADYASGIVLDAQARPVAGATVWLRAADRPWTAHIVATTDEEGSFRVRPDAGAWNIGASAPGHGAAKMQRLTAAPIDPSQLRIDLDEMGGDLRGYVAETNGRALQGVDVLWLPAPEGGLQPNFGTLRSSYTGYHREDGVFLGGRTTLLTQTDADGSFHLEGLALGDGALWVRREGQAPLMRPLRIAAENEEVTLRLSEGFAIRGSVLDAYGDPVPGATVELGIVGAPDHSVRTSDREGRFAFEAVPVGPTSVYAVHPEVGTTFQRRILHNAETSLELRLIERRVTGRVHDESGRPLTGWSVHVGQQEIERFGAGMRSFRCSVDAFGGFLLIGCPEEPFTLNVSCDANPFHVVKVITNVEAGSELDITIASEEFPEAQLRGSVVDRSGASPGGTIAAVRRSPEPSFMAVSQFWRVAQIERGTGHFTLPGLPAGTYDLMIQAAGRPLQWSDTIELPAQQELDVGTLWLETTGRLILDEPAPDTFEHLVITAARNTDHMVYLGDRKRRAPIPLPPGPYRLTGVGYGYQGAYDFEIRSGEACHLTLEGDVVLCGIRIVWPREEETQWARSWLYGSGDTDIPLTGWFFNRDQDVHLEIPLSVGSYRIETTSNDGRKHVVSVVARRGESASYEIDLSQ